MIVAVEEAKKRVTVGEDTASGLMLRMISWEYQNTRRVAETNRESTSLEYTSKWRVTANVKRCAVVVCNEDTVNPVTFKWK